MTSYSTNSTKGIIKMITTYDYSDIAKEIHHDLINGGLKLDETIQVLREERGQYNPIIDWYFNHSRMIEDLKPSLWDGDLDELKKVKELYEKDRPLLEEMTVKELIAEMKAHSIVNISDYFK